MAKKYYWLKLMNNFFQQPKIKKLRQIAGGDTYTIIYLKLQLLSLQNEGKIYFEGIEKTLSEELALIIDEDTDNVQVVLNYLHQQGLIEEGVADEYILTETQNLIGSETAGAERVRAHRQRKALQSHTQALLCNNDVTSCNTEIEKEIDIEIEKEKEIETEPDGERPGLSPSTPYAEVKNLYNSICVSYPKCTALSDKRKKAIKARFAGGYTLDNFKELFTKAEASHFLKGQNNRDWMATFDWLINGNNMAKVLDGNYDDKGGGGHGSSSRDHGPTGQADRENSGKGAQYGITL